VKITLAVLIVVGTLSRADAAPVAPCTDHTKCPAGSFTPKGLAVKLPLFRSYSPEDARKQVTRVIVVIHGDSRAAGSYFDTVAQAVANAKDTSTLVLAPHFLAISVTHKPCEGDDDAPDLIEKDDVNLFWNCNSWKGGETAMNAITTTSFDVIDQLIEHQRATLPKLSEVVIAGHSAGGQFVNRYAAATRLKKTTVKLRFVIANPSSYLYFDQHRPTAACGNNTGSCAKTEDFPIDAVALLAGCANFNEWKYGLEKRVGAAASFSREALLKAYLKRDIIYLLGTEDTVSDTDPDAGKNDLDTSCRAHAQGTSRLFRGRAYAAYLKVIHGAHPVVHEVPGCRHSAHCMFSSPEGVNALLH